MGRLWTLLSNLHSLAGPVVMLLYPSYASAIAIESPAKDDDEQWLAYWILYSLLTLTEMVLQSVVEWLSLLSNLYLLIRKGQSLGWWLFCFFLCTSALIGVFMGGCKCLGKRL